MKALFNHYVLEEDAEINRFDTLFKGITFDYIPLHVATVYAAKDALMTYELYQWQKKYLEKPDHRRMLDVYLNIEVPLIPILAEMYQYGVNMNQQMIEQLLRKYNDKLKVAEEEVYKEINKEKNKIDEFKIKYPNKGIKLNEPINIGSPVQLSILFYDILGFKTKSGKGTGIEDLEEIDKPLTRALIEYRKMSKLIDAFLVALNCGAYK